MVLGFPEQGAVGLWADSNPYLCSQADLQLFAGEGLQRGRHHPIKKVLADQSRTVHLTPPLCADFSPHHRTY